VGVGVPGEEQDQPSRLVTRTADAAALLAVGAVLLAFVLLIAQRRTDFGPYDGGLEAGHIEDYLAVRSFWAARGVSALLFAAGGWYLIRHRPRVVLGPLALAAGVGNALAVAGSQWVVLSQFGGHHLPGAEIELWTTQWGLAVEPVVLAAIFVLFPDGTWPARGLRWLSFLSVALCGAGLLHAVLGPGEVDPAGPLAPLGPPLGFSVLPGLDDFLLIGPGLLLATVILIVRWRRAGGELRRVLRSLAVVTLVLAIPSFVFGAGTADSLSTVVVLIVVVAGVLRHRVYGIDLVLNRTLVFVALTATVAAVYGALVGLVSLVGRDVGPVEGLVPAVAAAFTLFPARLRVQRMVNRFLYGERDEPYAVLSRIGARLEAAGSAGYLLAAVLESLVQALRVPYAAVDLYTSSGTVRHVEHGEAVVDVERFPLVHQGLALGDLVVGRRGGERALAPADRRLLEDVARQIAVAAANVTLTEELIRSRERVINAAEEERRRLRRDLHDGLGPVLTAAATRVDASRNLLRRDAEHADDLLRHVRADLTNALEDLRRVVYALRPPALDQLGLLGALREHVCRAPIPVVLHLPDRLPELSPALEVAAYRIVSEAVTNVTRHARASCCTVSISCSRSLRIEVCDDGPATGTWTPGVGLSSMRERTVELGGQWAAGPDPDGGGRVLVELPLRASNGRSSDE
jgi:signal transduction histidine kinase